MNILKIIGKLKGILLAAASFALLAQAAHAAPITDAFKGALIIISNFFLGRQYEPYSTAIDFFIFSILFVALYMRGGKFLFKEIGKPERVIIILLGIVTAFLLVIAGFSIILLAPFANWILILLLFGSIFWLLSKTKMHKLLVFILAILLTLAVIALLQGMYYYFTLPKISALQGVEVTQPELGSVAGYFKSFIDSLKSIDLGIERPGLPEWLGGGQPSTSAPETGSAGNQLEVVHPQQPTTPGPSTTPAPSPAPSTPSPPGGQAQPTPQQDNRWFFQRWQLWENIFGGEPQQAQPAPSTTPPTTPSTTTPAPSPAPSSTPLPAPSPTPTPTPGTVIPPSTGAPPSITRSWLGNLFGVSPTTSRTQQDYDNTVKSAGEKGIELGGETYYVVEENNQQVLKRRRSLFGFIDYGYVDETVNFDKYYLENAQVLKRKESLFGIDALYPDKTIDDEIGVNLYYYMLEQESQSKKPRTQSKADSENPNILRAGIFDSPIGLVLLLAIGIIAVLFKKGKLSLKRKPKGDLRQEIKDIRERKVKYLGELNTVNTLKHSFVRESGVLGKLQDAFIGIHDPADFWDRRKKFDELGNELEELRKKEHRARNELKQLYKAEIEFFRRWPDWIKFVEESGIDSTAEKQGFRELMVNPSTERINRIEELPRIAQQLGIIRIVILLSNIEKHDEMLTKHEEELLQEENVKALIEQYLHDKIRTIKAEISKLLHYSDVENELIIILNRKITEQLARMDSISKKMEEAMKRKAAAGIREKMKRRLEELKRRKLPFQGRPGTDAPTAPEHEPAGEDEIRERRGEEERRKQEEERLREEQQRRGEGRRAETPSAREEEAMEEILRELRGLEEDEE